MKSLLRSKFLRENDQILDTGELSENKEKGGGENTGKYASASKYAWIGAYFTLVFIPVQEGVFCSLTALKVRSNSCLNTPAFRRLSMLDTQNKTLTEYKPGTRRTALRRNSYCY